jgi:hypothetical protein
MSFFIVEGPQIITHAPWQLSHLDLGGSPPRIVDEETEMQMRQAQLAQAKAECRIFNAEQKIKHQHRK